MFTFGFSRDGAVNEGLAEVNDDTKVPVLTWISASKVEVSPMQFQQNYDDNDYVKNDTFSNLEIKLIGSRKVLSDLTEKNCENILEAELRHSDLMPAKYEGGLKIWECSYDTGNYILDNDIKLKDKLVLDLGCGAGIIGIIALFRGSIVHFQDYNIEVIESVTIPNVSLNFGNQPSVLQKCEFYCGDWGSLIPLLSDLHQDKDRMYDFIFTSETIYNSDNHGKLYRIFKEKLKENGVGYVAGKTHYFGVGGGMRQFEHRVRTDNAFDAEIIWRSQEGLQREILRLTWKQVT